MRMPTNRSESYRFTDVAPILAQTFEVSDLASCVCSQIKAVQGTKTCICVHNVSATVHLLSIVQGQPLPESLPCLHRGAAFDGTTSHTNSMLQVANGASAADAVSQHPLPEVSASQLVIVDGVPSLELSNLSSMPDGVYVGGIQNAPDQVVSHQLVSCHMPVVLAQIGS